jgi:hypothetical protein
VGVSPLVEAGTVAHEFLDHMAILKLSGASLMIGAVTRPPSIGAPAAAI